MVDVAPLLLFLNRQNSLIRHSTIIITKTTRYHFAKRRYIVAATLTCPICGKRNGYEFRYGGVDKGPRPDEEILSSATWCDYVHMNKCVAGVQKEWWFHRDGCGAWFTTFRDTTTNLEVEKPEGN
jgi:sarcosine oxidase subunit delta